MLYNPYCFVASSHIREKIYKGLNIIYSQSDSKRCTFFFDVDNININFLFKNYSSNRPTFYTFLLLLEKLTFVKFKFLKTKTAIANFNTKVGLIIGATYWLRSYKKNRFLHMFVNHSLNKLNSNIIFSVKRSIEDILNNSNKNISNLYSFFHSNSINFGLNKFLFHGMFSSNDIDYEFFLPLIERQLNGININLHFNFRHFLVNRLILSHNNINIY